MPAGSCVSDRSPQPLRLSDRTLAVDCQVFQASAGRHGIGRYSLALLQAIADTDGDGYRDVRLLLNERLPTNPPEVEALARRWPGARVESLDSQFREGLSDEVDFLMLAGFLGSEAAPTFPHGGGRRVLLFYDLIPYLFPRLYELHRTAIRGQYLPQLPRVYEADLVLAISRATADDLSIHLGVPGERVAAIGGAPIDGAGAATPTQAPKGPFILMPTGGDSRKNNFRGAAGFAKAASGRPELRLVLTSTVDEVQQRQLLEISDRIDFPGHVSPGEMRWYYEHATAVLFPSEYEGLGLPVLEAVAAGKPVACSDIPAVWEISQSAFYLFDAYQQDSIAVALAAALEGDGWPERKAAYAAVLEHHTWPRTADAALAALRAHASPRRRPSQRKLSLLVPDLAECPQMSEFVLGLHVALADRCRLEYFIESRPGVNSVRANPLTHAAPCRDAASFTAAAHAGSDAVVYNLGVDAPQVRTLVSALHLPGIAILHEPDLRGSFEDACRRGLMSPARFQLEARLDALTGTAGLASVLTAQHGLVVHSPLQLDQIPGLPEVLRLELPVSAARRAVWDSERDRFRVGVWDAAPVPPGEWERADLGHCPDLSYQLALARQDVVVVLGDGKRDSEIQVVLDAMRHGTVPIVRATGWFAELDEDLAVKLGSDGELSDALRRLARDPALRRRMGEGAREYVKRRRYDEYADALLDFTDRCAASGPPGARAQIASRRGGLMD